MLLLSLRSLGGRGCRLLTPEPGTHDGGRCRSFFTDGLIEHPARPIDEGLDELAALATAYA
ncbi:hypothetical protein AB0C59_28660, partial [Streptomyces sp. NPDC048664]